MLSTCGATTDGVNLILPQLITSGDETLTPQLLLSWSHLHWFRPSTEIGEVQWAPVLTSTLPPRAFAWSRASSANF